MEISERFSSVEFSFGPMPATFLFLHCRLNLNLEEVGGECGFLLRRHSSSQLFPVFAPPLPVAKAPGEDVPPLFHWVCGKGIRRALCEKAQDSKNRLVNREYVSQSVGILISKLKSSLEGTTL